MIFTAKARRARRNQQPHLKEENAGHAAFFNVPSLPEVNEVKPGTIREEFHHDNKSPLRAAHKGRDAILEVSVCGKGEPMASSGAATTAPAFVTLNNGVKMPMLGLGVYLLRPGKETYEAVRTALDSGYRLVDTAALYRNEADVGRAVRDSGIPREQVFVTTKLWNDDHGYEPALDAFDASLKRLDLGYIDLYLIHFPVPNQREDSWRALENILGSGRARAVGVSNYTVRHLRELLGQTGTVPAVNQVEASPFLFERELMEYCRKSRIQVEAYAPLTAGNRLRDPRIAETAARHGRTSAQVLLRWGIQHGLIVIPKSAHRDRIVENGRIFDFQLSEEDMADLDNLHDGYRTSWDPTNVP